MTSLKRRKLAAGVILPIALILASCGSSGGSSTSNNSSSAAGNASSGSGNGSAASTTSDDPSTGSPSSTDAGDLDAHIAAVTDSQLKGITISTADFFGDCTSSVGDNTDLSKAQAECPTFQTLINKFNADNKWGITVKQVGASWKDFYTSLNAQFAANKPPDITVMHESNIPDYSSRDLLLPLKDLYKVVGVDSSDFTDAALDAVTVKGKIYAVPFDEHAELLHVNMDLMKKAGLVNADGTPQLPTSVDELEKQAAQFKEKTGKQYWGWGSDFNIPFRMFSTLVAQQGKPVVSQSGEVNIDTPAGAKALKLMNTIYSTGIANADQTYASSQQAWLNGNIGMLWDGTWVVNQYHTQAKFSYQVANFPKLFDKPGIWANAHTWVIPKQQDADPVVYRAALEFASWMYQHDADWAIGSGHLSVRKSVLASDAYQSAPQRANYVATAKNAALDPQVVGWQAAEDAIEHGIEPAWLSGAQVDSTLTQTQQSVVRALKKK